MLRLNGELAHSSLLATTFGMYLKGVSLVLNMLLIRTSSAEWYTPPYGPWKPDPTFVIPDSDMIAIFLALNELAYTKQSMIWVLKPCELRISSVAKTFLLAFRATNGRLRYHTGSKYHSLSCRPSW